MKSMIALSLLLSAQVSLAETKFQCLNFAEKKAAKHLEVSLTEFREENSLIWSCKLKADPNSEEIQFGDGRGLVGVSMKIVNGKCTVHEIYSGQDDQDGNSDWNKENCL